MRWADNSTYKGTWQDGVQNGLGIMELNDGLKKAGTFKDNVLIEMLTKKETIKKFE